MLKRRYLFLMMIVCLFAISAVSAEEIGNDANMVVNSYDSGLMTESVSEDVSSLSLNDDEVVESADNGTFTALQKIDGADEGSIINSDNDYTIDKNDSGFRASDNPYHNFVGSDASVCTSFRYKDVTGNISVTVEGKTYSTVVNGGRYFYDVYVPDLDLGNHTAFVVYSGDDRYYGANATFDIVVYPKVNRTLNIIAVTIAEGENLTVIVRLNNEVMHYAKGTVNVSVGGKNASGKYIDGKGEVIFQDLAAGNYTGSVFYSGDRMFNPISDTFDVLVMPKDFPKKNVTMELSAASVWVNKNVYVDVELPRDATGLVRVVDGFADYLKDGKASPVSSGFITEGNYTLNVTYNGDGQYNGVNGSVVVRVVSQDVPKENVTMDLSADSIVEGDDAIIDVALSGDATGRVTASVGDENFIGFVKDSKASISIPGLVAGDYTIPVTYSGDALYYNATGNVKVTVKPAQDKKNLTISASADPITAGDDAIVKVTGLEDATGDVSVVLESGEGYSAPIKDGKASVAVLGLTENVTALVNYAGDDNYNAASTTVNITVNPAPVPIKKNLTIGASADPITAGDDAIVKVTGLEDATGDVSVIVKGETYTAPINKGEASVTVPGLTETVVADVNYDGDDNYNKASTSAVIVVNPAPEPDKKNLTIGASAEPITVGDNATVIVAGLENATGDVSVIVKGETYTAPINKGEASVTVPGLTETVAAVVNYAGDETYNPASTTVNITVNPSSINIDAPNLTKYFGGSERFAVNVTDSKGTPLSNKSVTIVINSRNYTRVTDENGTASMAIGLPSGTYNATVTVDNLTAISVVTVLSTVNGTDIVKMHKNGTQYYATFLDAEGKYLAEGTTVTFNINGIFYEREISGDKGLAKLNINLPPGEFVITAFNPQTGENAANNVTVLPTLVENRDITKYYKNATQYTVKVLGTDGNPVGAGKTVTFNINGIMYQRQTNKSGIAQLNINLPPENYTITASYEGYNVANNITVLPVLSASDLKMKYMDGSTFNATLLDGQGKPYAGQNVTFNINGVFYPKVTGDGGIARLAINLPAGEYIITSSYNGANIANRVTVTS